MIRIRFLTTPAGELVGFEIGGHSGMGPAGTDIVCAAVSSAAYMTANTVTEVLGIDADISISEKSGELSLYVENKDASHCRSLFAGLKLHLIGLEEQYPENIKVSYTEV